ncbi:sulfatase [Halobaculum gomorrense]|uniref:Arylsulfatase A n=1 Tax=Halobaculum gomorrense TaxID=43928 RepID=A0A1M5RAR5_9EURY|nr:sulfatase [Halobaculum gomorrense]SHH23190.1 arylsulfatase A [Halobaculum gomorrense]
MNVLLVVLDSVRAANCSLYGHRRETTPALESLAAEATVYDQARAPSNWSLPSHVSLFTGLETHVHGVTIHHRLDPGHTIFEHLAAEGYETGLFTENGFLASHDAGVNSAFETVETVPDDPAADYVTGDVNDGPNGFYYADEFLDWSEGRDGDWAACVNLMDAHRPFEPAPGHDRWGDEDARSLQSTLDLRWEPQFHGGEFPYWQLSGLESLYDGAIRQTDAVLRYVVDGLRDRDALEDTLLVVCGDHGDGFGEEGYLPTEPPAVSHIVPMHETLLHVPLVVRYPASVDPDGRSRGVRVGDPAALTRFPDVVGAARDGRRASFVPDVPVVASKLPITADLRERFERACGDAGRLFADSRAVYHPAVGDPGSVRKTYHWGEAAGALQIHAAGVAEPVTRAANGVDALRARERVDEAFARFDGANVRSPLPEEVTAETKSQLEALGYY